MDFVKQLTLEGFVHFVDMKLILYGVRPLYGLCQIVNPRGVRPLYGLCQTVNPRGVRPLCGHEIDPSYGPSILWSLSNS